MMLGSTRSKLAIIAGVALAAIGSILLFQPPALSDGQPVEVPSLSVWGKVFSVLLLAALGVAYLIWRRPIVQAQAILETSPLGQGHHNMPLVDWNLYLKTLFVLETLIVFSIFVLRWAGRPISALDTLGAITSGAIVALVVHLLIIARSNGGRKQ